MAKTRKKSFTETNVVRELAKELGYPVDEFEVDDSHLSGFTKHEVFEIKHGRAEYQVAADSDAMRDIAIAVVKQDLEQEPEIFDKDFLSEHIDMDRLRRDLEPDVQNQNYDYFNEMDDDDLISELQRSSLVEDPYLTEPEDEDEEPELSDREGLIEALAEEKTKEEMKDPMAYLEEIYGAAEAVEKAIEIAGIDEDAAAEEAVSTDGPEHFLAHYDGNSIETPSGFCYWRTN